MIRLSDPTPAFCSACGNSDPDARHIDFDSAHDGGSWQDTDSLAYVKGSEDLHVCERCVRLAAEALGFKPELHGRQLNEIRRQEIVIEHWKDRCSKLEALVATMREQPEEPRRVGRPRNKVAA